MGADASRIAVSGDQAARRLEDVHGRIDEVFRARAQTGPRGAPPGLTREAFRGLFLQPVLPMVKAPISDALFNAVVGHGAQVMGLPQLLAAVCILSRGSTEERLRLVFAMLDEDRDGFISQDDILLFLSRQHLRGHDVRLGSERLSLEAFIKWAGAATGLRNGSFVGPPGGEEPTHHLPWMLGWMEPFEEGMGRLMWEDGQSLSRQSSSSSSLDSKAAKRRRGQAGGAPHVLGAPLPAAGNSSSGPRPGAPPRAANGSSPLRDPHAVERRFAASQGMTPGRFDKLVVFHNTLREASAHGVVDIKCFNSVLHRRGRKAGWGAFTITTPSWGPRPPSITSDRSSKGSIPRVTSRMSVASTLSADTTLSVSALRVAAAEQERGAVCPHRAASLRWGWSSESLFQAFDALSTGSVSLRDLVLVATLAAREDEAAPPSSGRKPFSWRKPSGMLRGLTSSGQDDALRIKRAAFCFALVSGAGRGVGPSSPRRLNPRAAHRLSVVQARRLLLLLVYPKAVHRLASGLNPPWEYLDAVAVPPPAPGSPGEARLADPPATPPPPGQAAPSRVSPAASSNGPPASPDPGREYAAVLRAWERLVQQLPVRGDGLRLEEWLGFCEKTQTDAHEFVAAVWSVASLDLGLRPSTREEEVAVLKRLQGVPNEDGMEWFLLKADVWHSLLDPEEKNPLHTNQVGSAHPRDVNWILVDDARRLRQNITEGADYELITVGAWRAVTSWYGVGPPIMRRSVTKQDGRLMVELYPLRIRVAEGVERLPSGELAAYPKDAKELIMSCRSTLQDVLRRASDGARGSQGHARLLENDGTEVARYDLSLEEMDELADGHGFYLWHQPAAAEVRSDEEGGAEEGEDGDSTEDAPNHHSQWVLSSDAGAAHEDDDDDDDSAPPPTPPLAHPLPSGAKVDTHYPTSFGRSAHPAKAIVRRAKRDGEAYDVSLIAQGGMHEVPQDWIVQVLPERAYWQESRQGVVGLQNLGNTCYMAAALQCLSHTRQLREYFVRYADYVLELNPNSGFPGMNGKLALSFAELLETLWCGSEGVVAPRRFRNTVEQYRPVFGDYIQQDAQEFLQEILSGIKADLAPPCADPFAEWTDDEKLTDAAAASDWWEEALKRERSVITELFVAQYKTTRCCLQCKKKVKRQFSTNDMLVVHLPDPEHHHQRVVLYAGGAPIEVSVRVPREGATVQHVLEEVAELIAAEVCDAAGLESGSSCTDGDGDGDAASSCGSSPGDRGDGTDASATPPREEGGHLDPMPNGHMEPARGGDGDEELEPAEGGEELAEEAVDTEIAAQRLKRLAASCVAVLLAPTEQRKCAQKCLPSNAPLGQLGPYLDGALPIYYAPPYAPGGDTVLLQLLHRQTLDAATPCYPHTPQKELFSSPLYVGCAPRGLKKLRAKIWNAVCWMMPDFHVEGTAYPYSIVTTNANGSACSKCSWTTGCRGCPWNERDGVLPGQVLTLDWDPEALKRYGNQIHLHSDKHESVMRHQRERLAGTATSLEACLEKFAAVETTVTHCKVCKAQAPHRTQTLLWRLPPVFVMHLARFRYQENGAKMTGLVEFPLEGLSLAPWTQTKPRHGEDLYDLYAVVNHRGPFASGHYYSYILVRGQWMKFDDSTVAPMAASDVVTPQAYLLFYRQRHGAGTTLRGVWPAPCGVERDLMGIKEAEWVVQGSKAKKKGYTSYCALM